MRLIALTTLALLLTADLSGAQPQFPGKSVRLVVPYPAGGGTDVLGRLLADQLARKWGQSVIVENSGGAAGNIGAAEVFRAAPDGHRAASSSAASARCDRPRASQSGP